MSGATVVVEWKYSNKHADSWASSEILTVKNNQKVYVNNIQLSAAILLSGNNYQKFNLQAKFLGLASISESLFYRIQKLYCCPAIICMWTNVRETIHGNLPANDGTLQGDGRNDSPGHTATYCAYNLIDKASKLDVDLEVLTRERLDGSLQLWRNWHLQYSALRLSLFPNQTSMKFWRTLFMILTIDTGRQSWSRLWHGKY